MNRRSLLSCAAALALGLALALQLPADADGGIATGISSIIASVGTGGSTGTGGTGTTSADSTIATTTGLSGVLAMGVATAGTSTAAWGGTQTTQAYLDAGRDPRPTSSHQLIQLASSPPQIVSAADVDGDGRSDLILQYDQQVDNTVYWYLKVLRSTGSGYQDLGTWYQLPSTGLNSLQVLGCADLNGDGRADVVISFRDADSAWHLRGCTSTGSNFGSTGDWFTIPDWVEQIMNYQVAGLGDVDGDGRVDLVLSWIASDGTEHFSVFRSTGTGFIDGSDWATFLGAGASPTSPTTATVLGLYDINGDGRADLVFSDDGSGVKHDVYTWLSTTDTSGSYFRPAAPGVSFLIAGPGALAKLSLVGIADVNGDRRADLVVSYDTGTGYMRFLVARSNGMSFSAPATWLQLPTTGTSAPAAWVPLGFLDWNGDHRADLLLRRDGLDGVSQIRAYCSSGLAFTSPSGPIQYTYSGTGARFNVRFGPAEVNGDGHTDVLMEYELNDGVRRVAVYLANPAGFQGGEWAEWSLSP